MNGYAASKASFAHEEKLALIDERSLSEVESDSGRIDLDGRFTTIPWISTAKAYSRGLRLSSWGHLLRRTGLFLLPSFIQPRLLTTIRERHSGPDWGSHNPGGGAGGGSGGKLGPTAYLDGMRGLAALFVFFCHYFYTQFAVHEGWGHNGAHRDFWRLPGVRLLYAGPSMVCVFFIVSGYALSLKPLRQLRARQYDGLARTLTSFTFRRAFRLYLPTLASTFLVLVLLRLGCFEGTRAFADDPAFMRNVHETHPPLPEPTFAAQVRHWAWQMFDFAHVWSWEKNGGSTQYDVHLWTIPVEFRCSMVLFLVLLATARLRTAARFAVVAAFALFVLRSDRWEMLLFLAGLVFAELDLIRGAHGGPSERERAAAAAAHRPHYHHGGYRHVPSASIASIASSVASSVVSSGPTSPSLLPFSEKDKETLGVGIGSGSTSSGASEKNNSNNNNGTLMTASTFWALLSLPGLWLMSTSDDGPAGVPGFDFLAGGIPGWFTEGYRYWQMWGAAAFVFCAARSPGFWQRRVFDAAPVQYLGRVSYALYLMHGPVTHTAGFRVQRWAYALTGVDGPQYYRGVALHAAVNIPLVLWAADVFWRAVDAPIVRFTRWLEGKLSVEE
ncbi:acyltransferase [Xylariomycetidae sp. FL0641]|nr:acyltransferase [Xylariomycetidae sp. FL0641]